MPSHHSSAHPIEARFFKAWKSAAAKTWAAVFTLATELFNYSYLPCLAS
jgi:hypothetical protein